MHFVNLKQNGENICLLENKNRKIQKIYSNATLGVKQNMYRFVSILPYVTFVL